ncbi:hypothetical protein ACFFRR_003541 [Megaselia abdita]
MMKTLFIFVVTVITFSNCGVFDVPQGYFENKPICKEINDTLYTHVDRILAAINQTAAVKNRSKRSIVERNYNFTIISEYDPNVRLHVSTTYKVDPTSNYTTIIKGDPLLNLLPLNYKIEVTEIDNFAESIVWITGTRCRWECDKETKSCQGPSCWTNPSLCLGDIDFCTKNDGDGSCSRKSDERKDERDGKTFFFTSLDIEKYIYQDFKYNSRGSYITRTGDVFFNTPTFFSWMCNSTVLKEDHQVTCYSETLPALAGPSHHLLKTIAG